MTRKEFKKFKKEFEIIARKVIFEAFENMFLKLEKRRQERLGKL